MTELESHPTMGAWIEIYSPWQPCSAYIGRTPRWVRGLKSIGELSKILGQNVAPHDGCVDWNNAFAVIIIRELCRTPRWVRGLKSLDRVIRHYDVNVAPHDGCVDWNSHFHIEINAMITSHPTMGAWIEILQTVFLKVTISVAPHDGCVDWNYSNRTTRGWQWMSHPTMGAWIEIKSKRKSPPILRRSHPTMGAWIEISRPISLEIPRLVAPHDGCVDWNIAFKKSFAKRWCRTPRWVRGLKFGLSLSM